MLLKYRSLKSGTIKSNTRSQSDHLHNCFKPAAKFHSIFFFFFRYFTYIRFFESETGLNLVKYFQNFTKCKSGNLNNGPKLPSLASTVLDIFYLQSTSNAKIPKSERKGVIWSDISNISPKITRLSPQKSQMADKIA